MKTCSSVVAVLVLGSVACITTDENVESTRAALEAPTILTCSDLAVQRGSIGAGQSVSALAVRDQTGTADDWSKYVELSPNTSAVCSYRLPTTLTPSQLGSLAVRLDYRGPTKTQMLWKVEVWDESARSWTSVGDNAFAADWTWSPAELAVSGAPSRFFAGDLLKLRYSSASSADASQLDELVIVATKSSGSTSTTDAGTPTAADVGTSTPPPSGTIWRPGPATSWQWQLTGTVDMNVDATMFDIDLFDVSQATIDGLHARGRKVICYFSAGSYENWRSDASKFPPAALGSNLNGWPGERWLDIRNTEVRAIMAARMDLAVSKKCDGVEPDNVDGYANKPGFALTAAHQLNFNKWLASTAHARNLSIALKNDLDQVTALVGDFDFAVNEECSKYGECSMVSPFISAGKAVFHVEYGAASLATSVCPKTKPLGFATLIKNLDLGAWRVSCP